MGNQPTTLKPPSERVSLRKCSNATALSNGNSRKTGSGEIHRNYTECNGSINNSENNSGGTQSKFTVECNGNNGNVICKETIHDISDNLCNGDGVYNRNTHSGESHDKPKAKKSRKFDESEFIVCGIDYLPDFEKRRVRRRRGSRKFLKLESFNWTSSYIQFLNRARASLRASADSAVFCTSIPHVAASIESIPGSLGGQQQQQEDCSQISMQYLQQCNNQLHHYDNVNHHQCLSDGEIKHTCFDHCNSLQVDHCNSIQNASVCYKQNGFVSSLENKDLETSLSVGLDNRVLPETMNRIVVDSEEFHNSEDLGSTVTPVNSVNKIPESKILQTNNSDQSHNKNSINMQNHLYIFNTHNNSLSESINRSCVNSEISRTGFPVLYYGIENSSNSEIRENPNSTQLAGCNNIVVDVCDIKVNRKLCRERLISEGHQTDSPQGICAADGEPVSANREERTDNRLVFAGRFIPTRDGGIECELSRNVEGTAGVPVNVLTHSVPDIYLRTIPVKPATHNNRNGSVGGVQLDRLHSEITSGKSAEEDKRRKSTVSMPYELETKTKCYKNKNLKKKKSKTTIPACSVDITIENPPDEGTSFLARVETLDSGIDIVANGRSVTSEDDWKNFCGYPYENVVMSGGGSKGYAYIGALKALEDCGVLCNVKRIAGSSAGAICAGLLAVGCTPQEIADVFKCDIKWLFHDQTCACCCIPRVCKKYGIHPARRFHEIYGEHIARKVSDPDITFGQLLALNGRELCIVVTNLSRMCSEYCNPHTSPDMPIRDAVRMSMAFPVVFRAVRYNLTGRECLYADGGILDQYPVHCFDDPSPTIEILHNKNTDESSLSSSAQPEFNDKTIGLYVVSEKAMDYKIWKTLFGQEIPYKPTYLPNTRLARNRLKHELSVRKRLDKEFSKKEYMDELRATVGEAVDVFDHYEVMNKSHIDISNISEYFLAAVETLLISQRQLHVKPQDVNRTVAINCGYIGTNDYVIEPGDREFMINQGYTCTQKFLSDFINARRSPTPASLLQPPM